MTPELDNPGLPVDGEVHLWRLPQDPEARTAFLANACELLSAEEKARFDAMKRPGPAERFLRGRVLMRRVLARYLSTDPAEIPIVISKAGKPSLAGTAPALLPFNLTHSGSESVLAVAEGGDVGVDIEPLTRSDAVSRISAQFYSPAERRYLKRCGSEKAERALVLWCLKESVVKARGKSVWDGLAGLSIDIAGPRIEWSPSISYGPDGWRLAAGRLDQDTIIAVALRQEVRTRGDILKVLEFRIGSTLRTECQVSLELYG